MADDIPAGWYPDAHGTIRWWDGQRWTDHVRESSRSAAPPAPEPARTESAVAESVVAEPVVAEPVAVEPVAVEPVVTDTAVTPALVDVPEPAAEAETPSPSLYAPTTTTATTFASERSDATQVAPALDIHRPTSRVSYPKTVEDEISDDDEPGRRRYWLITTAIALATFFLGMGLGGQTAQPRQASDPLPPAAGAADPADVEALRQQLADRQAELDERQQVLDERESALDERAAEPSPSPSDSEDTPTPSPSATATEASGDDYDTLHVGYDIREGTYKTDGPIDPDDDCEYTISRDEYADDVISDEKVTSGTSVTLRNGDWFESHDCQDWKRD